MNFSPPARGNKRQNLLHIAEKKHPDDLNFAWISNILWEVKEIGNVPIDPGRRTKRRRKPRQLGLVFYESPSLTIAISERDFRAAGRRSVGNFQVIVCGIRDLACFRFFIFSGL